MRLSKLFINFYNLDVLEVDFRLQGIQLGANVLINFIYTCTSGMYA